MRFLAPVFALLAAVATAQQNAINIPPGGLQVAANTPVTITWTNPSSGTVTIKLQQGSAITPDSGLNLGTFQASALTATFTIPANEVNSAQYNFEIIDDTDTNNYNFSPGFTVSGATMVGTMSAGTASVTATGTAASSASASSLPALSSASASTLVTSTATSTSPSSASSSPSATSSSSPSSQPSSITNTNGAGSLKVQSGLLAALAGLIVVF